MAKSVEEVLPPRQPIAIIRLDDLTEVVQICRTLLNGGITILEFTLTNKKALETIAAMRSEFGEQLTIGAGTVLDTENALASIKSGAQFLVTPALLPEVIAVANKEQIPIACGAYTPTEILTAWRLGADLVKVFPAGQLGPGYIKDVLAPLPCLRLVPTGGVNLETCGAFLKAGAYTVAIGSQLISKHIVENKAWSALTDLAHHYTQACST